jgi:hypothetical protein
VAQRLRLSEVPVLWTSLLKCLRSERRDSVAADIHVGGRLIRYISQYNAVRDLRFP